MSVYEVKLPDGTWRHTDDLTGKELEAIEQSTGTPWSLLNPFRSLSAYRAIVGAFVIREGTMDDNALIEWFNSRKVKDLNEGIRLQEEPDTPEEYVDGVPKAAGGTSTSGSPGAPVEAGPPQ